MSMIEPGQIWYTEQINNPQVLEAENNTGFFLSFSQYMSMQGRGVLCHYSQLGTLADGENIPTYASMITEHSGVWHCHDN